MLKRILAGLIVAVVMASTAAAGQFEDGVAAYQLGDYATALKLWRLLAAQSLAVAQNDLGFMYDAGHGVPKDDVQAYMWFTLAAERGSADTVTNRDLLAKVLTPDQLAEAQRPAREWKPTPERP
jgi:TPR repeat protein